MELTYLGKTVWEEHLELLSIERGDKLMSSEYFKIFNMAIGANVHVFAYNSCIQMYTCKEVLEEYSGFKTPLLSRR